MVDAHQRNAEPAGGPRQGRLEVGDRQIGGEGVEVADHPVDQRPQLPGLVVEAGGDRPHHVEPAAGVLEDDARDLLEPHPRMATGEVPLQEGQGVGRGVDQDLMIGLEPLDERADPGGMAAALAAEADGDLRDIGVKIGGASGSWGWRTIHSIVPGSPGRQRDRPAPVTWPPNRFRRPAFVR